LSKILGLYLGEANQLRYFLPQKVKVPSLEEAAQKSNDGQNQERGRTTAGVNYSSNGRTTAATHEQAELELGQERQENQRCKQGRTASRAVMIARF